MININITHPIHANQKKGLTPEGGSGKGDQLDRQRSVFGSQDGRAEVHPEPAALRVELDRAAHDPADSELEADARIEVAVDLAEGVRAEERDLHLERRLDGERARVDGARELGWEGDCCPTGILMLKS